MSKERFGYAPVAGDQDQPDTTLLEDSAPQLRQSKEKSSRWWIASVLCVLLLGTNIATAVAWHYDRASLKQALRNAHVSRWTGLDHTPQVRYQGYHTPEYISRATAHEAWAALDGGHGVVAFDRQYAADLGLPRSKQHPLQPSKDVYVIAAYHALHCLPWLKNKFEHAIRGGGISEIGLFHARHCFDTLREELICNASDKPLAMLDDHYVGEGQVRECVDWAAIRDFATRHTANHSEADRREPGDDGWHHFDGGRDGVIIPDSVVLG